MRTRQERILDWAIETFGNVAADRHERAMRFVEEAIDQWRAQKAERQNAPRIDEMSRQWYTVYFGSPPRIMACADAD